MKIRIKLFTPLCILFLLFFKESNVSAQNSIPHAVGLRDPTKDQLDTYDISDILGASPTFVTKQNVDLSIYLPEAGNQGIQQSCTAFSVAYGMKTIMQNIRKSQTTFTTDHFDNFIFSPAFNFNLAKKYYYGDGGGTGISYIESLLILRDSGVVTLSEFNYQPNSLNACLIDFPSKDLLKEAKKNRIFNFKRVDPNINDFKKILSQNFPIGISVKIQSDVLVEQGESNAKHRWTKSNPFIWSAYSTPNVNADFLLKHAMVIVGYDEKGFKVLNSWGKNFGSDGYFYISYDFGFHQFPWGRPIYDAYYMMEEKPGYNYGNPSSAQGDGSKVSVVNPENLLYPEHYEFSTWFKSGYYQIVGRYQIGCFDVDEDNKIAIVRFTDLKSQKILNQFELPIGRQIKFRYKDETIKFVITKIDHEGSLLKRKMAATFNIVIDRDPVAGSIFDDK